MQGRLKTRSQTVWRRLRSLAGWQQVSLALAGVILAQLAVPTGTVSLLARLDGRPLAFTRSAVVKERLAADAKQVEFRFDDKDLRLLPEDLGWEVSADQTTTRLPTVSLASKLLPFGVAYKLLTPANLHTQINRDAQKQLATANQLINKYSAVPVNASAQVTQAGQLALTAEKPGRRYELAVLKDKLSHVGIYGNPTVKLKAKTYDAEVRTSYFDDVKKQVEKLRHQKLMISVQGKKFAVAPATYLPKLEVRGKTRQDIHLQFSTKGLETLLDTWGKNYDIAPGTTVVTYVDGEQTDRKDGAPGRAIDKVKAAADLQQWLKDPGDKTLSLVTANVAPHVKQNRSYSSTSAGLQARLSDWARDKGGGYHIAAVEIGGAGRSAYVAGSQSTVLASTYKLFVAYAAYRLAEKGELDLGKQVAGKSIEDCLNRAVVYSDNDCAKAVGLEIGWAKCDEMVQAAGFDSVKLNNYNSSGVLSGEKTGTASDLAAFLRRLHGGSLLNEAHTASLLGYMKRQVYRQGIPAGSAGAAVADKVGFLGGYTHDAGIVYAPGSDYVLVVMSNRGSNWSNIKEVSQLVYDFFKA